MRQRIALFLLAIAMVGGGLVPTQTLAANGKGSGSASIQIIINGSQVKMDVPPLIDQGNLLIPIRALSSLGLTYTWDASSSTASIRNKEGDTAEIKVNSRTAYVNGKAREMGIPAQSSHGRILVPIRFVTEALGYQVEYSSAQKTVNITSRNVSEEEYDLPEAKVQKQENGTLQKWALDGFTLSFEKRETEGDERADGKYFVSSVSLQVQDHAYPVELSAKPNDIRSMSLSASGQYLALELVYTNVGNRVIVMDLISGKQTDLNQLVAKNSLEAETIHSYQWSPEGDILAFGYGDTSSSRIGAYDFGKKSALTLSAEPKFITTAFILWKKDGQSFDVIGEQPSDQFKKFRYRLTDGSAKLISEVNREELGQYSKYRP